jgi:hypothetical protein
MGGYAGHGEMEAAAMGGRVGHGEMVAAAMGARTGHGEMGAATADGGEGHGRARWPWGEGRRLPVHGEGTIGRGKGVPTT